VATATRTRRRTPRTAPVEAEQVPTETTAPAPVDQPAEQADAGQPDGSPEAAPIEPDATDQQATVGEPAMLSVDALLAHPDNVRDEVQPNPGLVANLKTDGPAGLLYPIIVVDHPDGGGYLILDGHERVLSFQEAAKSRDDLTHIPAMIRPDLADRAEQIVVMIRTGVHRRQLSSVEVARGLQQLALAGLSEHQIAKRTGYKRPQVKDALAVAGIDADTATKVKTYGLDLHQAAVVADFADDNDAVARLLKSAENGPIAFDKAAAQERDERTEAQKRQARIQELTDAGITVLAEDEIYRHNPERKRINELLHDGQPVTPENHAECPGHAVAIEQTFNGFRESAYCTNWRKYKHTDRYGGSRTVTGPMSDEQKAERRTVIANNKAMKAANEVRRKWLVTLFARKSIKGAARFVAETMVSRPHFIGRWVQKDAPLLDDLLGTKTNRHDLAIVPASANDPRCIVYALAAIAAAHENEITHETWRHNDSSTARWFQFLRAVGYDLDPVEQMVIDKIAQDRTDAEDETDAQADADEPVDGGSAEQAADEQASEPQPQQDPDTDAPRPAEADPAPDADSTEPHEQDPADPNDPAPVTAEVPDPGDPTEPDDLAERVPNDASTLAEYTTA
jgi:ParB family chromosome partitioning protein